MDPTNWLVTSAVVFVVAGWLITNLVIALRSLKLSSRREDLIGFLSGIFSLPIYIWLFFVASTPTFASKWLGTAVILMTLLSLGFQFARLWNTSDSAA